MNKCKGEGRQFRSSRLPRLVKSLERLIRCTKINKVGGEVALLKPGECTQRHQAVEQVSWNSMTLSNPHMEGDAACCMSQQGPASSLSIGHDDVFHPVGQSLLRDGYPCVFPL